MEESRKLIQWIHALQYPQLPERVVDQTKALVLDHLGCQLAGATLPWSRSLLEYFRSPRPAMGRARWSTKGSRPVSMMPPISMPALAVPPRWTTSTKRGSATSAPW